MKINTLSQITYPNSFHVHICLFVNHPTIKMQFTSVRNTINGERVGTYQMRQMFLSVWNMYLRGLQRMLEVEWKDRGGWTS